MTNAISGVALVAIGVIGLYFKVDYSGWVVFVGCLVVLW